MAPPVLAPTVVLGSSSGKAFVVVLGVVLRATCTLVEDHPKASAGEAAMALASCPPPQCRPL